MGTPLVEISDMNAWAITLSLNSVALFSIVYLRSIGVLEKLFSRKLMHIATGPTFVICWLLFPAETKLGPIMAASAVGVLTLMFVIVGSGFLNFQALTNTVSRTGTRAELLRGPTSYGIVHIAAAMMFWRDSPTGVSLILILCAGDGMADIIGRKYGSAKLLWNPLKSWAGSIAFIVSAYAACLATGDGMADIIGRKYGSAKLPWSPLKSWAGSIAFIVSAYAACLAIGWVYIERGFWGGLTLEAYAIELMPLVVSCAVVESITTIDGIDNLTVFVGGAFVSYALW